MAKTKILIVEDERIAVKGIQYRLKRLGYGVAGVAASGKEAIQKARDTHPDLVLMDILLQGDIDGVETAEQIRAHFDIPVIYLTSYADDKTLQRAKVTEPYGYIIKPFEENELRTAIEMALYKHKIERRLRESEETAQVLLNAPDGTAALLDTDGTILAINEAGAQRLGKRPAEIVGVHAYDLFPPDLAKVRKAQHEEVVRSGKPVHFEDERGGLYFENSMYPVLDAQGKVSSVAVYTRDVTKRKRAEQALLKSEKNFRNIFRSVPESLLVINTQLDLLNSNRAFAELINKYAPELSLSEDELRATILSELKQHFGKTKSGIVEIGKGDGELIIEFDFAGKLFAEEAIIVSLKDITERKRAEDELKVAQEYARNLIDSSLDMIISVDKKRRIIEFNRAAQKAFGYSKAEVLGKHINLLYADPAEGLKAHKTSIKTGRFSGEIVNKRKNGETFPSFLSSSILSDENGEFLGVMGVSRDITERKRIEEEREKLIVQLQ
ncbi:MAG: PAS domain S-box protein [Candidatus Marinimicrobia bacterium]|nr:PAS domain S-box protein [Candidatus Neomarinimicrobiota bacterium]